MVQVRPSATLRLLGTVTFGQQGTGGEPSFITSCRKPRLKVQWGRRVAKHFSMAFSARISLRAGTGFSLAGSRLKIAFEFARGLLWRSLQIERAHEFPPLVPA